MKAYEEIVEFIASGTTPGNVASFRPSETTKERIADLIQREKRSEAKWSLGSGATALGSVEHPRHSN
jgi:hypothetical protein